MDKYYKVRWLEYATEIDGEKYDEEGATEVFELTGLDGNEDMDFLEMLCSDLLLDDSINADEVEILEETNYNAFSQGA